MRLIFVFLFLFVSCSKKNQEINQKNSFKLTIAENIDSTLNSNNEIISVLTKFLKTKNEYRYKNEYWLESDFPRYYFPYSDIFEIEKKGKINNFYQPILLEILDTDSKNQKLLKIAYIGDNTLKILYSVIIFKINDKWILKNALDYNTKNWQKYTYENINYFLPASRKINLNEVKKQVAFNEKLSNFFNYKIDAITYYSCNNPIQLFNIKGIDYTKEMYFGKYGGFAQGDNIVFSGNNSEYYPHEISHLYSNYSFRYAPQLLKEGVATLFGGQGKENYNWHRERLQMFIEKKPDFNFIDYLEPYKRIFVEDNKTSIPYMVGALIVEKLLENNSPEELTHIFEKEKDLWKILERVNITKDNFNEALKAQLSNNLIIDF